MRQMIKKNLISITNSQLALIHVAKKELGLSDEDYQALLATHGGVTSAKYLMLDGFEKVMKRLETLGFESSKKPQPAYAPTRDPDGKPYPAQISMINHYFTALGIAETARRQGICKRITGGMPWPQTRAEANKIIEGLKAMLARGYNPR